MWCSSLHTVDNNENGLDLCPDVCGHLPPDTYLSRGGDIYGGSLLPCLMEVTWSAAMCPVSHPVLQQENLLLMESFLLADIRMAPLLPEMSSSDCSESPLAFL